MQITCPACGALMGLDVVVAHEGAREAVEIAMQLPAPLGRLLIQYVALFRPGKTRRLSLDRLADLLGELLPMIQAAQIRRDGQDWPAPQEVWAQALREMLDRRERLSLPLKSHGYLLEIIAGMGQRSAAKAESRREEQRRERPAGKRRGQPTSAADALAAVSGLRGALKGQST